MLEAPPISVAISKQHQHYLLSSCAYYIHSAKLTFVVLVPNAARQPPELRVYCPLAHFVLPHRLAITIIAADMPNVVNKPILTTPKIINFTFSSSCILYLLYSKFDNLFVEQSNYIIILNVLIMMY